MALLGVGLGWVRLALAGLASEWSSAYSVTVSVYQSVAFLRCFSALSLNLHRTWPNWHAVLVCIC